jgi:hypothetical protein
MHDEELGADRGGSFEFGSKGSDAFEADLVVFGGEINQITVVDDEWGEPVFGAIGAHFGAVLRRGH